MKTLSIGVVIAALTSSAGAQTTFVFHDDMGPTPLATALDAQSGNINFVQDAVVLRSEAFLDGNSVGTAFNSTASLFGIDNPGSITGGLDRGDRFDNLNGIESAVFSIPQAGIFNSIDLRFIESNQINEAQLLFANSVVYELNFSTDTGGTTDIFAINQTFGANEQITLRVSPNAPADTNFSLESFTVTVPEPNGLPLAATVLALTALSRRRKV